MANNPNVNKVVYGNQTVMDITDTTVEPENVLEGEVFYTASGARSVGTAIGGIPEEELRDTVGWTGKNLIPYPYWSSTTTTNGITFTDNGDGTISANGTATADAYFACANRAAKTLKLPTGSYIISGCPSGGSSSKYMLGINYSNASNQAVNLGNDYGDGKNITITNDIISGNSYYANGINIVIKSGQTVSNLLFKPMIRLASISDATYEPYHPSVKQTLRDAEVIEGKNLIPYPYKDTTMVENYVTFTDNGDGTILVNGTASGNKADFEIRMVQPFKKGKYILSGCPSGGSSSSYCIWVGYKNNISDSITSLGRDTGDGFTFTLAQDCYISSTITVSVGTTVSNLLFKPMLRYATEEDATYEPYYIPLKDSKFDRSEQGILGAKNLIPYPYSSTTFALNNVTFTDNGDGSVTISTSSAASADTTFLFHGRGEFTPKAGRYIWSAKGIETISDNGDFKVVIQAFNNTSWVTNLAVASKDTPSVEVDIDYNGYNQIRLYVTVYSGKTVSTPVRVYPMLRLASDSDDTWQPYAMTNKDLTGKVGMLAPLVSPAFTGTPTAPTAAYGTDTTQIATTAFVQENKTAVIDGLTSTSRTDALSARCGYYLENSDGHVVQRIIQGSGKYRFPYSGYSEYIQTGSIIIPVSDPSSSGTPYKFKSLEVHSTYNSQTSKYEGYAELDIASDLPFNTMVELLIFNVGGFYG